MNGVKQLLIKKKINKFILLEEFQLQDAFKNGENIYDTIMIIYGARYENEIKNKIERKLQYNIQF